MKAPHPILSDGMILPTNELERLTNEIDCWLNELSTGGCVWGNQRIGKTMGIRFLLKHGAKLLGADIPSAIVSVWEPTSSSTTENRFFMEILRTLGHEFPRSGTAADKRIRLLNLIEDMVRRKDEHRFLLFLDEAQFLTDAQLRFLMDIHNQLKLNDIRLITVLVGQPELRHRRMHLLKTGRNHLVSRFFCNEFEFKGPRTEKDLKTILRHIDKNTEWPKDSGISYTEHFAPKAYKNSWRLEHQSTRILTQLKSVMVERSLPTNGELPMQAIIALIRRLLKEVQKIDSKDLQMSDTLIAESIKRVAIINIENHVYQTKHQHLDHPDTSTEPRKRKAA